MLGPDASNEATFTPRSAFAELIEISPTETTLLLNLTSSERTCDALPAPSADEVAVSIRLSLPSAAKLVPGSFPLVPAATAPLPSASPLVTTVKLRGRKHELRPGGELALSRVEANPQGVVEGLLKLEFAGDAEQPATRVSGRFLAHFCRINRLR